MTQETDFDWTPITYLGLALGGIIVGAVGYHFYEKWKAGKNEDKEQQSISKK